MNKNGPTNIFRNKQTSDPKVIQEKQPIWQSTQIKLLLQIDDIKVISFD